MRCFIFTLNNLFLLFSLFTWSNHLNTFYRFLLFYIFFLYIILFLFCGNYFNLIFRRFTTSCLWNLFIHKTYNLLSKCLLCDSLHRQLLNYLYFFLEIIDNGLLVIWWVNILSLRLLYIDDVISKLFCKFLLVVHLSTIFVNLVNI